MTSILDAFFQRSSITTSVFLFKFAQKSGESGISGMNSTSICGKRTSHLNKYSICANTNITYIDRWEAKRLWIQIFDMGKFS